MNRSEFLKNAGMVLLSASLLAPLVGCAAPADVPVVLNAQKSGVLAGGQPVISSSEIMEINGLQIPTSIKAENRVLLSNLALQVKPTRMVDTNNYGLPQVGQRIIQYYEGIPARQLGNLLGFDPKLTEKLATDGYFVGYGRKLGSLTGGDPLVWQIRYITKADQALQIEQSNTILADISRALGNKYDVQPYGSTLWRAVGGENGFTVNDDFSITKGSASDFDYLIQPKTSGSIIRDAQLTDAEMTALTTQLKKNLEITRLIDEGQINLFASRTRLYRVFKDGGVQWCAQDTRAVDVQFTSLSKYFPDGLAWANLALVIAQAAAKPLNFGLHSNMLPGMSLESRIERGASAFWNESIPSMLPDIETTQYMVEWPIDFLPQNDFLTMKLQDQVGKEYDVMKFGIRKGSKDNEIVLKFRADKIHSIENGVLAYVVRGIKSQPVADEITLTLNTNEKIAIVYPADEQNKRIQQTLTLGQITQQNSSLKGTPAVIIENVGMLAMKN